MVLNFHLQVLILATGGGFSAPIVVPISEIEALNPDPAAAQLRAECDLAPAAPKPPEILSLCFAGARPSCLQAFQSAWPCSASFAESLVKTREDGLSTCSASEGVLSARRQPKGSFPTVNRRLRLRRNRPLADSVLVHRQTAPSRCCWCWDVSVARRSGCGGASYRVAPPAAPW